MSELRYELRVRGRVGPTILASFEGWESHAEPGSTALRGPVRDQSELHGLIDRVQDLGLELIDVRRLAEPGDDAPPPTA